MMVTLKLYDAGSIDPEVGLWALTVTVFAADTNASKISFPSVAPRPAVSKQVAKTVSLITAPVREIVRSTKPPELMLVKFSAVEGLINRIASSAAVIKLAGGGVVLAPAVPQSQSRA